MLTSTLIVSLIYTNYIGGQKRKAWDSVMTSELAHTFYKLEKDADERAKENAYL